ncbi:MAG: HK97 family phage prohead protease [Bacteroidales bacterium]|jgi:hypothetical protein|nr:HK97 family phage prohead protease [Bacteroidales bacterium]
MKEFLISDESLNSHGLTVRTSGIRLDRFLANPVMYYNHDRSQGVIGRWENLRVDGSRMFAAPVFDMNDELGKKIARKVEDGFIKAASIGITDVEGDMREILSCVLYECSICDIPANPNTLALYHNDLPVKSYNDYINIKLSMKNQNQKQPQQPAIDTVKIAEALGLPAGATEQDILAAIAALNRAPDSGENIVNSALQMKYISSDECGELTALGRNNAAALARYVDRRKTKRQEELNAEFDAFMRESIQKGRISAGQFDTRQLREFAASDFQMFKRVVESIPERVFLKDLIRLSANKPVSNKADRNTWTLRDYRKYAPQELRNNPQLYAELVDRTYFEKQ